MPPCLAPQRVREAWEVMGTKARLPSSASMLVCPSRSGATAPLSWHCPQGLCSPLGAGASARLPPDRQGREPEGHAGPWVAQRQLGDLRVKPCQNCASPIPSGCPCSWGRPGDPDTPGSPRRAQDLPLDAPLQGQLGRWSWHPSWGAGCLQGLPTTLKESQVK